MIPLLPVCNEVKHDCCTQAWGGEQSPYSPAERPEPGQVIRVIHIIANSDNLMETFDLDTHHLHKKRAASCNTRLLNTSFLEDIKNVSKYKSLSCQPQQWSQQPSPLLL